MASNNQPKASRAGIAAGGTGAALVALALAVQAIKPDEGYSARTYLDVANLPTYCYGHLDRTSKVGTYHPPEKCEALLSQDVGKAMGAVEKCTPILENRPYQLAAATRLTFNIGAGAYCRSSVARNFNAGNIKAGCNAFLSWRYAGGKEIRGLKLRRQREMAQCLTGL